MIYSREWNKRAHTGITARIMAHFRTAMLARKLGIFRYTAITLATLLLPATSFAAIAFDAAASAECTASPCGATTLDLTTLTVGAGSNRDLNVCVETFKSAGTADVTSAVWDNGGTNQSMTLVKKTPLGSDVNYQLSQWNLINPISGNKTLRVTVGSVTNFIFIVDAASYSGVSQTGFPDSQNSGTRHANTAMSATTTVVVANSWLVACGGTDDVVSAGSATTQRANGATFPRAGLYDGNADFSAGAQQLNITPSVSTTDWAFSIVSMAPAAAAVAAVVTYAPIVFVQKAIMYLNSAILYIP